MHPDSTLLLLLKRHGVPFVVIGGHAVIFHGYERSTDDADVVWMRSPEAEINLAAALAEVNASRIGRDIDPTTGIERLYPVGLPYVQANHLMMLWTKFGFFDLFDYIPGYPEEDTQTLFNSAVEAQGMHFASVEWLKKMKEKAGRDKDLLDLKRLAERHSPDSE